jgi:NOL1/NOP2/sun family putative RNA methylase
MQNIQRLLPQEFLERLNLMIPSHKIGQVMKAFNRKKPTTFRANRLKISAEELKEKLENRGLRIQRVNWHRDAFMFCESLRKLTELDLYKEGYFYVQSLSSMVPPLLLAPQKDEKILDIAAAPGSKTTQIASMMRNTGEIVANDISPIRLEKLRFNLKVQGVTNVRVINKNAKYVWLDYRKYFDRSLVDVACSMEGKINCFEPKSYSGWSIGRIKDFAYNSKQALRSAVSATKHGGRIVYSTCTLAPEENEEVIDWILDKEDGNLGVEKIQIPGLQTEPALRGWEGKIFDLKVANTMRIFPTEMMEGFYLAVLSKH